MYINGKKIIVLAALALTAGMSSAGDAPPAYVKTVLTTVVGKLVYPKMAKMRHQEGVVGVTFAVGANGEPSGAAVEKTSGVESLDNAALEAVNTGGPYPAPPEPGAVVHGNIRFTAE